MYIESMCHLANSDRIMCKQLTHDTKATVTNQSIRERTRVMIIVSG